MLNGDEWTIQSKQFSDWCQSAVDEIGALGQQATDNLESNMQKRIQGLGPLAIEAAAKSSY